MGGGGWVMVGGVVGGVWCGGGGGAGGVCGVAHAAKLLGDLKYTS